MKTQDIIAGMALLLPYYDNPDGYHTGCTHEELRMHPTSRPVSAEDLDKLIQLGWHQEHDGRGNYSEDFSAKDYRADEAWVSYV